MKMIFWGLFSLVLVLCGLLAWASYPWSLSESVKKTEIVHVEPVEMMEVPEHPSVIKVLTFNVGFLFGKGSEGPGYQMRDKNYFENALAKVSEEIKTWDADIVFLQEIDFEAHRSHNINQAEYISRQAGYPYVAEALSWDANYIPFPYWPLQNHFGRMKSGGAILSRFPLENQEITLLPKPMSQPWWYNLFYLHRYFQKVTVLLGDKKFTVINLHLEAFDKADRKLQVEKLVKKVRDEAIDFVAGDFNMLPQSASNKSKFENDDNYENDKSYVTMMNAGLLEVIPDEIYLKDEARFFTFPSWRPGRRLDYIWYRPNLKMMKAEVLSSTSSDHLPLKASFQIDGPRFNPYQ
jgi:endonuclease/exonuclease/phosphatase family metal-dependent hydrolase